MSLNAYTVILSGKKNGHYAYQMPIDSAFFANLPYALIKNAQIDANVQLEKLENQLVFKMDLQGSVEQTCDRCLATLQWPVHGEHHLYVTLTETPSTTEDDDAIQLHMHTPSIDLSPFLYEHINLAIPLKVTCDLVPNCTCDQTMLDKINQVNQKEIQTVAEDPRWEKLKKIKF